MTGNLYVLLSLAEGILSFLPAVGTAAARGSRSVVHRTSRLRAAMVGTVTATIRGIRAGRTSSARTAEAAVVDEVLSP